MNEIIITTTNSISGAEIDKYLGLVTTNLVIGTNVFSDFLASFSDFFGGMSGTYRNQLDLLYKRALDDLMSKANKKRADAILGIKIDFDEISGQGKSMFMVSITGTAVKLVAKTIDTKRTISLNLLREQTFLHRWAKRDVNTCLSSNDWDIIFDNNLVELALPLYKHYLVVRNYGDDYSVQTVDRFQQFMSTLSYSEAVKVVYYEYSKYYEVADKYIHKYNLFSPSEVLSLLENNNVGPAVNLLKYDKAEYTGDDIMLMNQILQKIDELPDVGNIESVKSGILSSKKEEKYICKCGQHNSVDMEYCSNCSINKKGFSRNEVKVIETFREKICVLAHIEKSIQ